MEEFMKERAELKDWARNLTSKQLHAAWELQQLEYEEEDIGVELENNADWYAEKYGTDKRPVTDEEFADMVGIFDELWTSEDYRYSEAREAAVLRVLRRREGVDA